jgi:hypothetical protein
VEDCTEIHINGDVNEMLEYWAKNLTFGVILQPEIFTVDKDINFSEVLEKTVSKR